MNKLVSFDTASFKNISIVDNAIMDHNATIPHNLSSMHKRKRGDEENAIEIRVQEASPQKQETLKLLKTHSKTSKKSTYFLLSHLVKNLHFFVIVFYRIVYSI